MNWITCVIIHNFFVVVDGRKNRVAERRRRYRPLMRALCVCVTAVGRQQHGVERGRVGREERCSRIDVGTLRNKGEGWRWSVVCVCVFV